jgi:transcriptional regulator with XRE-family HTH domain
MALSTETVEMTPAQCRAARALLDLTQPQLAAAANLGLSTIVDFERSRRSVSAEALATIRAALESAGVEFTNGDQPGVRLKRAPR